METSIIARNLMILALCTASVASAHAAFIISEAHPKGDPPFLEVFLAEYQGEPLTIAYENMSHTLSGSSGDPYTGYAIIGPNISDACLTLTPNEPFTPTGSSINVTFENTTREFSYSNADSDWSYQNPCNSWEDCLIQEETYAHFFLADPTPCTGAFPDGYHGPADGAPIAQIDEANETDVCATPEVEIRTLEEIFNSTIRYRIIGDVSYTYWIEFSDGTQARPKLESASDGIKQYTPPQSLNDLDYIFTIFARYTDPCTNETITEYEYALYKNPHAQDEVCEPETVKIETTLAPEPPFGSFYTLARTPSETYTYRFTSQSDDATFFSCVAQPIELTDRDGAIPLAHEELITGQPALIAVEDTTLHAVFGEKRPFMNKTPLHAESQTTSNHEPEESTQEAGETEQVVGLAARTGGESLLSLRLRQAYHRLIRNPQAQAAGSIAVPAALLVFIGYRLMRSEKEIEQIP